MWGEDVRAADQRRGRRHRKARDGRSSCNSWSNGGNVPGKKRMYMGYTGGSPEYRRRCDEIAVGGYTGFTLD
jgi:hypothetical protein